MPVLNEASHLGEAVGAVLSQEYPGEQELVLALGASNDGTDEVAAALAASDPRVRLVGNPRNDIPIGLNLAIAASSNPVVIRVDAHAELPAGYTAAAVEILHRTGRGERRRHDGRQGARTVPERRRPRLQLALRPRWRLLAPRRGGDRIRLRLPRGVPPRGAGRGRRLRRDPAPRRGLGAQPPHPLGRPPDPVHPEAQGHLLAPRQLGRAAPPDVRHRGVARPPRPPAAVHARGATCRRRPSPSWWPSACWSGCSSSSASPAAPAGRWRTCRPSATSPA